MNRRAPLSALLSALLAFPAGASAAVKTGGLVPAVPLVAGAPAVSGACLLAAAPALSSPGAVSLTAPALSLAPAMAALPAPADAPKLAAAAGLDASVASAQDALKAGDDGSARAAGAALFDAALAPSAAADGPAVPAAPAPEDRRSSGLSPPSSAEVAAAFAAARPRSPVLAMVPASHFAALASDLLMQYTFASREFLAGMASQIPFFDMRGQAMLAVVRELVAVHDATDAASRRFSELAGRWYAFAEAQNEKRWHEGARVYDSVPPHMPPSPLPEGEYWDMAAGINAGRYVRRPEVDKTTPYALFDLSPFVASYIRTSAALAGKPNVTVREEDLLRIERPAKPLAVLRTKNAVAYVPGFERKLEEMVGWIAPGGQLVIQSDPGPGRHEFIWEKHERLIRRLLRRGWGFEFGFAGARGKLGEYGYDTLVLTRPAAMTGRRDAAAVAQAWESYRAAVRYRYRRYGAF